MSSNFCRNFYLSDNDNKHNRGVTLVELAIVIVLVVVIASLSVGKIDFLVVAKQQGEIRKFLTTWELLFNESLARGVAYRLTLDLGTQSYSVRREVIVNDGTSKNVDYLENLRTRREKERRNKELDGDNAYSLEQEFNKEDERQSLDLETLFYTSLFADPEGTLRLAQPIEFPSLGQDIKFGDGVIVRDVKTEYGTIKDGKAVLHFSPRGTSDFAVIHFLINDDYVITALLNPWTGDAQIFTGDKDFEWTLDENQKEQI